MEENAQLLDLVTISTQLSRAMEDLTAGHPEQGKCSVKGSLLPSPEPPVMHRGRRQMQRRAIYVFMALANLLETGQTLC